MDNEIIEKIARLTQTSPLREADVQHLFTLSRKLIERAPKAFQQKYALLKFYCDWTVHPGIDRSEAGASVLAEAHNIIADHLQKADNSTFATDITHALSFDTVRDQLNELLNRFGTRGELIDQAKWGEVVPIVAEIISHCPLKIDHKIRKLAPIIKSIQSRPLKGTSVVEELTVIKVPSTTFYPDAKNDELTYCIMLSTTDTTKFITPMARL